MTPAARYQGTIDLLESFLTEARPADGLASYYFRKRRYIGSSDRRFIYTRFYRILRRLHRLNAWHEELGYTPTARSFLIADSVISGEQDAKTLAERIFTGEQFAPEALSASEQKLADALKGKDLNRSDFDKRILLECPEWAWSPMVNAYGLEKAEKIFVAMKDQNDLHLRVNTLNATREDVMKTLKKDGFETVKGELSPWCIRLPNRPQILKHDLVQSGKVEIQNEGSQLIALATQVQPGMRVMDFCAGAGGKTLAMAAMMDNKGSVVAGDVLEGRLKRSKQRFRRAGIHNIETRALSSQRDKWVKRQKGKFDVVLVDAPCSGIGTWRGDPDKRWRQLGPGLSELVPLQTDILDSAARMVKPGGQLVYATCSLLPIENEKQIEGFLRNHPEFELADYPDVLPKAVKDGRYMKANPADHDSDGFFAAVMVRKAEEEKDEAESAKPEKNKNDKSSAAGEE